jgi:pimeloyl-ACP methyl ester carboxylesterase
MAMAQVTGATIAYDDTGGDGPPVVLAHGFLMDRTMFDAQVAALSGRYRMITWDERGFGETVYDGGTFTYWDSAADCLGLMDHLGIDRAVVGGMSQGGFIGLRVALLATDRVRGLILLDTQAGTEDPDAVPLYEASFEEWVTNGPSDDLAELSASIIIGDPDLGQTWKAIWMARPKEALASPGRTLLDRESIADRLAEITAPALVVHGTADVAITMDRAEALAAGLSGCDGVVAVEGGTHAANMTHPDAVNEAILGFLAGLPD